MGKNNFTEKISKSKLSKRYTSQYLGKVQISTQFYVIHRNFPESTAKVKFNEKKLEKKCNILHWYFEW